jgi:choline dehydrogenase
VEAIHVARDILSQPAFALYDAGQLSPGPEVETDEEILEWVARDAETAYHPSCHLTNGNIHAPVMMLAEKSADLILGNTPSPPATADFHRHRAQES